MRVLAVASIAFVGAFAGMGAQQPPAKASTATAADSGKLSGIAGWVFDSIHGTALVGATVRVEGATTRVTKTASDGQFRIDSLPPGLYVLNLAHPLLDTLGVSIGTVRPIKVEPGTVMSLDMAVPSARGVIEKSCAPAWRARGPSALVGRVLDADTDSALVGAKVSLVWQVLSLTDFRKVPTVREQPVGKDGVYRICGLPTTVDGTLQATFNGQKTAEVHVILDESNPLAFQSLRIGTSTTVVAAPAATVDSTASKPDSQPKPKKGVAVAPPPAPATPTLKGPAKLSGRVINAAGTPVSNARIEVMGTGNLTLSRDNGEFAFVDLPSGTQSLIVRQLGFEPVELPVELSGRVPRRITVTMTKPARTLEAVVVTAKQESEGLDKVGFTRRQKSGMGYYMGSDAIEKRQALRMTDLFRTVPSLKVTPSGNDYVVESARDVMGGCVRYVLDGSPYENMFPGDVDRMIPPNDVAAIEVYSGSNTPAEFQGAGQSSCTTIVMWSRFKVKKYR
jgi:hypothetical protein